MKKLIIGSDKSGFVLKEAIKKHLTELGYEVMDQGTINEDEPIPYYAVADKVAKSLSEKEVDKGILICGTGMGMSIVANKHKGVYAAVCENTFAAEKARAINDANVLSLGGWITGDVAGCAIVDTFLNTEFTQNLEEWRAINIKRFKEEVINIEDSIYGK